MSIRRISWKRQEESGWRKFIRAAITTQKAPNQHLFSYCEVTTEFLVLLRKMFGLVADTVYLIVLNSTIKTAQQHHCFIHYSKCKHNIYGVLHKLHVCGSCFRITNS